MILEKIKNDLNQALKASLAESRRARDEIKISTLRFLLAAVHNRKIEKQTELAEEDVLAVVRQQAKQYQESIAAYRQGKRDDLIKKEVAELDILNTYLPRQMPSQDLEKIIKQVISEIGASGPKDFGKVMGAVMAKVKSQADGSQVADLVKKILGHWYS